MKLVFTLDIILHGARDWERLLFGGEPPDEAS